MWFRVAALLGATVEEIEERLTAEEFMEWCAFYEIEPWGYAIQNWRMGVLGATVANYAGRSRKSPDAKPSDFIPSQRKRRPTMSAREMKAYLQKSIEDSDD